MLIGVGIVSNRMSLPAGSRVLAAFPLLFGVHQGIEGVIWLSMAYATPVFFQKCIVFIYEIIAVAAWPILCPLSVLLIEPSGQKRPIVRWFLGGGILLAAYLAWFIAIGPLTATVGGCSLQYDNIVPFPEYMVLIYVFIVASPYLLARNGYLVAFGIFLVVGWRLAALINELTFVSVWCFFAAILSLLIYFYFRSHRQGRV